MTNVAIRKNLSSTKANDMARSLLGGAEEILAGNGGYNAMNESPNFCGDRYRRTAYKLSVYNAKTLEDWKGPENGTNCRMDIIDMFCGCGGVSLGFLALNRFLPTYRLAGALDIDPVACQTFEKNLGIKPLETDIQSLLNKKKNLESFLESCDVQASRPLVLIGCPPCQGFSSHRKKNWDRKDHRNNLVESFAKVAVRISPDFIFMENVPELLSNKYWKHFENFRKILKSSGYLVSATIVNMAKFGVPQARHRAIVFGFRERALIPEGYKKEGEYLTVRHAISNLEPISSDRPSENDPMHKTARHRETTLNIIRQVPKDGGSRPQGVGPECLDRVNGFYDVYGRLYWDKPAITITAYARNPASGRFIHPEQDRGLSTREVAILQSFPKQFQFEGSFDNKFSQIGNAVPPKFAAFTAAHILGELASAYSPLKDKSEDIPKPVSNSYSSKIVGQKLRTKNGRNKRPIAIEAFCGAGGLSLGLINAGFDIPIAYDNDKKALLTYRDNLGDHAICSDATEIDLIEELKREGYKQGQVILVAGGPPCQGFSVQRRGEDEDPRNSLVSLFFEQALSLRPPFVLMENVLGLRGKRGKALLEESMRLCNEAGYFCHVKVLNAADFAVPQIRKRMFWVAERIEDDGVFFEFPTQRIPEKNWKTVWDAISDLPAPPENGTEHPSIPNHRCDRLTPRNKERFSHVKPAGGREQIPPELRLPCHMVDADTAGHRYVYGRLHWQKPAGVITARFDSLTRGRFGHPEQNRTISLREGARLQSFPDSYIFTGTKTEVARQIGNAVPPLLAEAIGMAIIEAWSNRREGKSPKKITSEEISLFSIDAG